MSVIKLTTLSVTLSGNKLVWSGVSLCIIKSKTRAWLFITAQRKLFGFYSMIISGYHSSPFPPSLPPSHINVTGIDELSLTVFVAFQSFQNDAIVVICNISPSKEEFKGLIWCLTLTHSDVGKAIQLDIFTAFSYRH